MEDHSIKKLLDKGLCVTVNSDDPAYFGGYVNENYIAIQEALHLTRDDLYQLARNSFEASFLELDEKEALIRELDAYFADHLQFRFFPASSRDGESKKAPSEGAFFDSKKSFWNFPRGGI